MQIRFDFLIWILVLSLTSGISWMTAKEVARQQISFRADIDSLLSSTIHYEFEARIDTLANYFIQDLKDSSLVRIRLSTSSSGETIFNFTDPENEDPYTSLTIKRFTNQEPVWTPQLKEEFYATMKNHIKDDLSENITYYWTDTLGTRLIKYMNRQPVDTTLFSQFLDQQKGIFNIKSKYQIIWNPDSLILPAQNARTIQISKSLPYQVEDASWKVHLVILNPMMALVRRILPILLGALSILSLGIFTFVFLYRTLRQQRKLMILKDDFIDNITHELQTPITALRMASESLGGLNPVAFPERRKKYLQIFNQELARLSTLVDRLLQQSWQEEPIQWSKLDLKTIIQSAEQHLRQSQNKSITFNYPLAESPKIWSDPDLLFIIIHNIIQNSAKYSDDTGVIIDISWSQKNNQTIISIADNGWGVPPADRKQIFEKFSRSSDKERNYTVKGLGIGLYHTKKNVQKLGGHCMLKPNSPQGSIFIIHLPTYAPNSSY